MGGAVPGLMALSSIRKQNEQTSKQLSSMASVSSCLQLPSLFEFLPYLPLMMDYDADISAK